MTEREQMLLESTKRYRALRRIKREQSESMQRYESQKEALNMAYKAECIRFVLARMSYKAKSFTSGDIINRIQNPNELSFYFSRICE